MKTISSLIAVLAAAFFLASCSGNLQIEKRHYRSGWYVSTGGKEKEQAAFLKTTDSILQPGSPRKTESPEEKTPATVQAVSSDSIVAVSKKNGVAGKSRASRNIVQKTPVSENTIRSVPEQRQSVNPDAKDKEDTSPDKIDAILALAFAIAALLVPLAFFAFVNLFILWLLLFFMLAAISVLEGRIFRKQTTKGDRYRILASIGMYIGIVLLTLTGLAILGFLALFILGYSFI